MTPWTVLLRLTGLCRHLHRFRELDGQQVLWLVCSRCSQRVEAITREPGFIRSGENVGTRSAVRASEGSR